MKTQLKKALDELRRTLPPKLSEGGETTGEGAINIGVMNRVRAAFAIAIGKYHTIEATATSSCVFGDGGWMRGAYSVGNGRTPMDHGVHGMHITGAGNTPKLGGVQYGRLLLYGETTNATAKVLCSVGNTPNPQNQLVLQNNSVLSARFYISVYDATTGYITRWSGGVAASRGANATTTAIQTSAYASKIQPPVANAYTFTVTADTTNGALRFSAIGDAAKTLRWLVNIEFEEIAI